MRAKKRKIAPKKSSSRDLAALEAEYEAAQAVLENDEEWTGRDPAVIEAEMHEAQHAAQVSAELNIGAAGTISRREFEDFKFAVAVVFIGIQAALRDPRIHPESVINLIQGNVAAMGFSRAQAEELADFQRRANVVEKHYRKWDQRTKSTREYGLQQAAMMRPRIM
jgi:hypothetical protein